MKFRRFFQTYLSSIIFLLLAQAQVTAQPFASEAANPSTPQSSTLIPDPFIPALPPLKPTLPEPSEPLRLVLRRGERKVYVYQGKQQLASYPVAVGRSGWETPLGTYQVINMQKNPVWQHPFTGERVPPGPNNPLGERWIGFWTNGTNYIGFHGTPDRASVGTAASHGCVRMFNEDIRKLYEIVAMGTPVIVEP